MIRIPTALIIEFADATSIGWPTSLPFVPPIGLTIDNDHGGEGDDVASRQPPWRGFRADEVRWDLAGEVLLVVMRYTVGGALGKQHRDRWLKLGWVVERT